MYVALIHLAVLVMARTASYSLVTIRSVAQSPIYRPSETKSPVPMSRRQEKDANNGMVQGIWSPEEHERFLEAMVLYPQGPWVAIANHVGPHRSVKQVQTHGQKYQQKLIRQQRGLHKSKSIVTRPEHRIDTTTFAQFTTGSLLKPSSSGSEQDASASMVAVSRTRSIEEEASSVEDHITGVEPIPFAARPLETRDEWSEPELCELMKVLASD